MNEKSDKVENEENEFYKNSNNINHRISLEELFKKKLDFIRGANMGRTGLVNIGNTCFMNSALQCLSNCYELTKYFLLDLYEDEINKDNKLGSGGEIASIYRELLDDLWNGEKSIINPGYFKKVFSLFVKKFSGYHQQDSNEFLIYLLDRIHEDLNSVSKKPYIEIKEKGENESDEDASIRWWETHLLRENSIIVDLFHGQFKNTITCDYCNRVSVTYDSYIFLSLSIPSGKFEIDIKYFGYDISKYFDIKMPLTENTTVQNIIDIIKVKLLLRNKNIKSFSNPPKKKNKRSKYKSKIANEYDSFEQKLDDNLVEIVLLTKGKKIYKVFTKNEYIFPYYKAGYEIVAYEKNGVKENIYFYLTQYYFSYIFSYFYYPRTILFDYPFAIDVDMNNKIYSIHENIYNFVRQITKNKKDSSDLNFKFDNITIQNEKIIGFSIYLNMLLVKRSNGICESISSSSKSINYPLLEKHSSNENIETFKRNIELNENDRLCFDINLFLDIDKTKFPKISHHSRKISFFSGNDINIYDCLNLFSSEEILEGDNEWYCNICKRHRDVNKKMEIYKSPYYLIIQLKRFKQDEMESRSIFNIFNSFKNNTLVDFPIRNLDLSEYISSNINSNTKYDLIGVINHYGGASFGHYTAYCLNNGNWLEYNDHSVSYIDENNVVSNAAYVLFYKKINN